MNAESSPASEVVAITDALESVIIRMRSLRSAPAREVVAPPTTVSPIAKARYILRSRRRREAIFGLPLFGEPAWDILLDIYVNGDGRGVSVSSACLAGMCPPTTGLRYVTLLEESGMLDRVADPADRRRFFLHLSAKGRSMMETFLSEAE